MNCPHCGGEGEQLGVLARVLWLRCVDCGTEWKVPLDRKEGDGND